MKAHYNQRLLKIYAKAPLGVQRAFDKQVNHLLTDPHHPSLRTKKYDEARGLWQARIVSLRARLALLLHHRGRYVPPG